MRGFGVLPVRCGGKRSSTEYLYVRRHEAQGDAALPAGRTLFVVNVPPDGTRGALRELFRDCGAVEAVHLHDGRDDADEVPATTSGPPSVAPLPALDPIGDGFLRTCSNAHVLFVDTASLDKALRMPKKYAQKPCVWRMECDTGLAYLVARHQLHRPRLDAVKRHADTAVERYAWIRANPQWLLKERLRGATTGVGVGIQGVSAGPGGELLDKDGFTIVQKGARYGRSGGEDAGSFAAITPEMETRTPRKKELTDFYRFQFREKKRQRAWRGARGAADGRIRRLARALRGGQGEGREAEGDAAVQAVRGAKRGLLTTDTRLRARRCCRRRPAGAREGAARRYRRGAR